MEKQKIIVVLGMHRSGTSAAMKAIETLGVSIGDNLMPAAENNNPKGFFEDMDINLLNIEMLSALGTDWHHLRLLTSNDIENLIALGYKQKAFDILRDKLNTSIFFGFKDPRVSKLIEFWKIIFAEINCEITYVYSIRNPFSVAKSLEVRDGFSHNKSYLLWLSYNISTIVGLEKHSFVVIDYDDLIANPDQQVRRIAAHLLIEPSESAIDAFSSDFIDDSLRHSFSSPLSLQDTPLCPEPVVELYKLLLDCTNYELINASTMPDLFSFCKSSYMSMNFNFQLFDQMNEEITHKNGEVAALKNKIEIIESSLIAPLQNTMQVTNIKLYPGIMDNNGINFSEDHSASATYCIGEGRSSINLEFEFNCKSQLSNFRFDIADMPCFIQLYSMHLSEKDGRTIWSWESSSKESPWVHCKDIHIINHDEGEGLYLASLSDDPQLYLNIGNQETERTCTSITLSVSLSISALAEHSKKAIESLAFIRNELILFQKYDESAISNKEKNAIFSNIGANELEKFLLNNFNILLNERIQAVLLKIKEELETSSINIFNKNEIALKTTEKQYLEIKTDIRKSNDISEKMIELFQLEQQKTFERDIRISQLQIDLSEAHFLFSQYKESYEQLTNSSIVRFAIGLSGAKAKILSTKEH